MTNETSQTPETSAAQAPAYQAPTAHPVKEHSKKTTMKDTNTFAVLSIILAFFQPIAAIVFGHMSLAQIKRNGDEGRGLALAGLIIGYASIVIVVLLVIAYIAFIAIAIATLGATFGGMDPMMGGYESYEW